MSKLRNRRSFEGESINSFCSICIQISRRDVIKSLISPGFASQIKRYKNTFQLKLEVLHRNYVIYIDRFSSYYFISIMTIALNCSVIWKETPRINYQIAITSRAYYWHYRLESGTVPCH